MEAGFNIQVELYMLDARMARSTSLLYRTRTMILVSVKPNDWADWLCVCTDGSNTTRTGRVFNDILTTIVTALKKDKGQCLMICVSYLCLRALGCLFVCAFTQAALIWAEISYFSSGGGTTLAR